MPDIKWITFNMMAIERDLLPEHLANVFIDYVYENRDNKLYRKCLEIAEAILNNTDITDEKILEEVYRND